MAHFRKF